MTEEIKGEIKLSEKAQQILSSIEAMNVLELSEMVKAMEKKFGVSAASPVVAVAGGAVAAAGAAVAEEKTSFKVVLAKAGDQKIQVIKEIRAVTNLGLKEAKDLVEGAPKTIKEDATKDEAQQMKQKLEAVGAVIELK